MFLPIYLAISTQEFANILEFPSTLCYFACHFSPSGEGLSNLPTILQPGSILSIDDSTPIAGHSKNKVIEQIKYLTEKFNPCGILLDFQRPDNPFSVDMIESILEGTQCPVAVSHIYARELDCPVFLPPLPYRITVQEYLNPWSGREIWLELGNEKEMAIVTQTEFCTERVHTIPNERNYFRDPSLLCHYCTYIKPDHIAFYFQRTAEDLAEIQAQAQALGASKFVGLWQQLRQFYS